MQDDRLQEELNQLQDFKIHIKNRFAVYILNASYVNRYKSVLYHIGRTRKLAFSEKGAGGINDLDIDEFDSIYHQMFVTKENNEGFEEIIAGYRFFVHKNQNTKKLDMERLFKIDAFLSNPENIPAIELGRSYIVPECQKKGNVFYSLFCGLGIIFQLCEDAKYFFGKITFYPNNRNNDKVLDFLSKYHPDNDNEILPKESVSYKKGNFMSELSYKEAYRDVYKDMPEILNIYLKLTSPQYAKVSGTSSNEKFGKGIKETAFRIYIPQVNQFWKKRFLYPFESIKEKLSIEL